MLDFRMLFTALIGIGLMAQLSAAPRRAMTIDDLLACQRLSEPQFSPDGQWIAFTVAKVDEARNKIRKDVWLVRPDGQYLQPVTRHEQSSSSPCWSPDGKTLAYLSSQSGTSQVWLYDLASAGHRQLTDHHSGVESMNWSPDGRHLALASRVYPDAPDQESNRQRDQQIEANPVQARVYDELLFRHWDSWWDHKRSHIMIFELATGKLQDLTPGDYDVPPIALSEGYCFTPDGQQVIFTSNREAQVAKSTNNDIWAVPVGGGIVTLVSTPASGLTFKGNDSRPAFSPDGKYLAFLSMARPGYEADKTDLILKNWSTGNVENLTRDLDIQIDSYEWIDASNILLVLDQEGRQRIHLLEITKRKLKRLTEEGYCKSVTPDRAGGRFAYLRQTMNQPDELWVASVKNSQARQITFFNKPLLEPVEMSPVEDFWFKGAGNQQVHGYIVRPPFFDPNQRYAAVFMVHGGPQGAWHDGWHYRWNPQLWAAQGYVVVLINPRGSTGYGQRFTDEIRQDWGGRVFGDLVAGQKYVVDKYRFIDETRLAAAGASYGGFMMNWIEGHMDAFKYPFRTLINHDGTFNVYSQYLTTEELWFPEWEFGGPYWENDQSWRQYSPHNYVQNFKTPMLVIHGERDYRLDFGEGLMAFTALRRQGVRARLVLFPDEGHWVLKPHNSRFWHQTVFEWLATNLK